MAKKMRKVLAMLMALALCAGQLAIPAAASETEPQIVNAEVNVTVTELGTTAEVLDSGELLESTTTKTEWNGTTENGGTVTGEETKTEYTGSNPESGYVFYEGGSTEGSEKESLTTTETNTEIQKDVILSDTTEITGDASETAASTTTQEGQWEEDLIWEGQWIEGETVEGEYVADEGFSSAEESSTAIPVEEPTDEVTINMTPNAGEATVTKEITLEELVDAILQLGEEMQSTKEITDENGNVIGEETVTRKDITDENGTVIGSETETVTTMKGEEKQTDTTQDTVNEYEAVGEAVLPEGVKAGTETIYDANGEAMGTVETVIEEIRNDDGTVTGYKIIKTTTTNTEEEKVAESADPSTTVDAAPVTTIRLPEKPAASETTDEASGNKTAITVNDILDADGNVTGYEIVTTVTDAEGKEISSGTEKRYGTVITVNETTVTDPTTVKTITKNETVETEITEINATGSMLQTDTVTTRLNEFINTQMTEKSYDYIEMDGKLYFIYSGEMTVTEGAEHGNTDGMLPIQPDTSLFKKNDSKDLASGGDLYKDDANWGANIPDDGFKLVGNGISSALTIGTSDGSSTVTQFKLSNDAGKTFYAMCVDLSTYTQSGYFYDIEDITNQTYYQTDEGSDVAESAEKIRVIALNGFWGTKEGLGSLTEVKTLLTDYLKTQGKSESEVSKIVNSLTEGQALAATQAALWEYGAKDGSDQINEKNLVTNGWSYSFFGGSTKTEDYTNTEYLYKALLAEAANPSEEMAADEGVEFLDAADVTSGSITLKEKTYDAPEGPDTYNTDISFALSIEPRKLNGDLVVNVLVDGKEVESYRLTDSQVLFDFGRIEPNADGSYTIENVELKEGVVVTLNLAGTQDLGSGVYIYTSEIKYQNRQPISSQTLVGLATGERKVDIDINMKFNVEDPEGEAKRVSGSTTEGGTITDTRVDTRTDTKINYKTDVTTTTSSSTKENGSIQTQAYADVTITESITETTETERTWKDAWKNLFEPEPTEPEVTEPEVTEPEVTEPEVTEPEVTEPEPTEPEPTEPEPTEPEPTEPEPTEPEPTEPEPTEPEPTEPEPTEPEPTEPEPTEPEPTEPEPTEPEPTEPEPTEPEPTEPEPTEPEPTEPEPTEPQPVEPQPEPIPAYDPGFPIPEPDGEVEIPDEDVPLAAAPKTGDISALWAVISAASLGGAVLVNKKRKEEE